MPLDGPQRIGLARLLGNLRHDWEDAGTHSAVVQLADDHRDPITLCRQALERAAVASNRAPTCILFADPTPERPAARRLLPPTEYVPVFDHDPEPAAPRKRNGPPPGLRDEVADLLNVPAIDRVTR